MFFISLPSFIGYLLSAVYYLGMQLRFGDILCRVFGLLYKYSSYLYRLIDWVMELIPGEMTAPENADDDICAAFMEEST